MRLWYPQFHLVVPLEGRPYWTGTLKPYRTRRDTFRIVLVGSACSSGVPKVWCTRPEISKRTYPFHPHLNVDGSLCTFFVPDRTYDPLAHDISRLVDLVGDWLRRHIHLLEFGFWPGDEAPHEASGVLRELQGAPDAACICGSGQRFRLCCRGSYQSVANAVANGRASRLDENTRLRMPIVRALRDMYRRVGPVGLAELLPRIGPPAALLSNT
jgi:hypothetical protein